MCATAILNPVGLTGIASIAATAVVFAGFHAIFRAIADYGLLKYTQQKVKQSIPTTQQTDQTPGLNSIINHQFVKDLSRDMKDRARYARTLFLDPLIAHTVFLNIEPLIAESTGISHVAASFGIGALAAFSDKAVESFRESVQDHYMDITSILKDKIAPLLKKVTSS